jgi:hypothetical protein
MSATLSRGRFNGAKYRLACAVPLPFYQLPYGSGLLGALPRPSTFRIATSSQKSSFGLIFCLHVKQNLYRPVDFLGLGCGGLGANTASINRDGGHIARGRLIPHVG